MIEPVLEMRWPEPVPTHADAQFLTALTELGHPKILVGRRRIAVGDELSLMPEEARTMARRVKKVRRASGAARIVARDLLQRLGHVPAALPKKQSGAAKWPAKFVGSLAHDADIAVAAVGLSTDFCAIGIDIEPREGLDIELHEIVAKPSENRKILGDLIMGRMFFVVKEAVFKAVNEADHLFLEFHDIDVDLDRGEAHIANGRIVKFRAYFGFHLVALAFIPRHFSN